MANGSNIDRFGSPSYIAGKLQNLGMNFCNIHIANKYGTNLRNISSEWHTGSGTSDIQPYIDQFESDGIYYKFFSWRSWDALNRHMAVPYTESKERMIELAAAASGAMGPHCLGYISDWEYDGWGNVRSEVDPDGNPYGLAFTDDLHKDNKAPYDQWLTNRTQNGFMQTMWNSRPDLVYGGAPNGAYWHPYVSNQLYSAKRQIWYNHQNYNKSSPNPGAIWGKIANQGHRAWSYPGDGCWQIGLSAGQWGDLGWHIGVDHTRFSIDPDNPDTSSGLQDHLLYALLDDPKIISLTMTGGNFVNRNADACPICGYDSDYLDPQKELVIAEFGSKLTQIPWNPAVAKWGDLRGQVAYPTDAVSVPDIPDVAYMLDTQRLWIINMSNESHDIDINWSDGESETISVGAKSFETTVIAGSYVTPHVLSLDAGRYRVTMPPDMKSWEDGSTDPAREIDLSGDRTIIATWEDGTEVRTMDITGSKEGYIVHGTSIDLPPVEGITLSATKSWNGSGWDITVYAEYDSNGSEADGVEITADGVVRGFTNISGELTFTP
jgi:hypothetical protein